MRVVFGTLISANFSPTFRTGDLSDFWDWTAHITAGVMLAVWWGGRNCTIHQQSSIFNNKYTRNLENFDSWVI